MSAHRAPHSSTLRIRHGAALALPLLLALAGCGKVTDMATEKAAEKMLESTITKDGGEASVKLGEGGVSVEGKDEKGQAYKMEMGSAQITEKEIDLPFYPGAKLSENGANRIMSQGQTLLQLELDSTDDAKKVAAWYREQLKARMANATVIDQSEADGSLLSISTAKPESSIMIDIKAQEGGSKISLMHGRKAS
ncbi:hypothetical protein [Ideonella sp.]|uniref:hypothetical protein n=1 Tax=Ideonella sp. TaxID=1929293 RepID=UPI003BB5DD00